jgi:hypothetical protein
VVVPLGGGASAGRPPLLLSPMRRAIVPPGARGGQVPASRGGGHARENPRRPIGAAATRPSNWGKATGEQCQLEVSRLGKEQAGPKRGY